MRWNLDPLYPCGRPRWFFVSPVQNWRKFSAVFGTTSLKSSKVIRPRGSPGELRREGSVGTETMRGRERCHFWGVLDDMGQRSAGRQAWRHRAGIGGEPLSLDSCDAG